MLLCPADIEKTASKEISRPLEVTYYPAINDVGTFVTHWFKLQQLKHVEIALEKRPPNGDENGVGAVWAATYYKEDENQKILRKLLVEVKSVVPNQQIDFVITVVPRPEDFNCVEDHPSHLTITAVGKGESTELTAKMATRIHSTFATCGGLFYCPCCWPFLLVGIACTAVCYPCCTACAKDMERETLLEQCDKGLSAIKEAVERGPEQQVMSDHALPGTALPDTTLPAFSLVSPPSSSSSSFGDK